jgi:hypothetical protein
MFGGFLHGIAIYFGQPSGGRFFRIAVSTASSQLATPVIFSRSGFGVLTIRFGFGALAFTFSADLFFIVQIRCTNQPKTS